MPTKTEKNICNGLVSLEAEVRKSISESDYKYDRSPTSSFLKDVYKRFEVNPCLPSSELESVEAEATRLLRNYCDAEVRRSIKLQICFVHI